MAQNQLSVELFNLASNDTNSFDQSNAGLVIGGGGGGNSFGAGASTPIPTPTSRTISFNLNSSPIGAAIFVDGVDTQFRTPHTLQFSETELLTPKVISVRTSNRVSIENYVISSEMVGQNNFNFGGGFGGGGTGFVNADVQFNDLTNLGNNNFGTVGVRNTQNIQ